MNLQERIDKAKVFHIDLDGTICKEECWTPEECVNATPNKELIRWMWKIYTSPRTIIIYTARRTKFSRETIEWLDRNNVPYTGISFKKQPTDIYIDDKAYNVEDLNKLIKRKKVGKRSSLK